ncbi:MAG: DUF47 family protein [Parafilimonas sp.]
MPKDRVFYSLFEEVAETVITIAKSLKDMVNEPDKSKRSAMLTHIKNLEHKNDETTHRIFTELGRNFITPFDREDIHHLATALDDVADYIYSSAKKIIFYSINPDDSGIKKLADLIELACVEIKTAVYGLRNMRNLHEMTGSLVKVNSIENQADDVFDMSIDKLFEKENDVKTLIKKREIYQSMENATDKCEDAVNVIESIIVKYA